MRTDDNSDEGPLLGALLRICHHTVATRIADGFRAHGFPALQAAVTQPLWDAKAGMRLTDLAARAGVTKQSMGELVDQMETAGYIGRVADPADGRARLVRLTRQGRRAGELARKIVREVQAEWAERVGRARIRALEETLRAIVAIPPTEGPQR
jgi:DNA-binding MarR family transcriptional regulator